MEAVNEIEKNQYVIRTTEVNSEEFKVLKNAKSFNDVIKIKREIGNSYYYKNQLINQYSLTKYNQIWITCGDDELSCVITSDNIADSNDTEVEIEIMNGKFFEVDVEINNMLPPDEDWRLE